LEKSPEMTLPAPTARSKRAAAPIPSEPSFVTASDPATYSFDPSGGVQLFLLWDLGARLFIWSTSLALTFILFNRLNWWPAQSPFRASTLIVWRWAAALAGWVLLCNIVYLAELIFFRIVFPLPQTGVYPTNRPISIFDRRSRQLVWAAAHGVLTKARYQAPFPAFLVYHLTCLPPFRWLVDWLLGPHTKSTNISEPLCLDPAFITVGRNVVIGSGTSIAGHIQVPEMLAIRKTIIEDNVLIGTHCVIFGGAHIKCGAIVAAGSVVAPYTVIGANEYWSGVPAVKVRDFK
jgi:hypothetical protein